MFIKDGFYNLTFDIEGEDRPEVEDMETDDQQKDDHDEDDGLGDDFKEALEKDDQHANGDIAPGSDAYQGDLASGGGICRASYSVGVYNGSGFLSYS